MADRLTSIFRLALDRGDGCAVEVRGRRLGWPELVDEVRRASGYLGRAGVARGDRVVYQGPQRVEALVLFWATMLRGAVFAPLDDAWPEPMVARAAGRLGPRVVVSSAQRAAGFRTLYPLALNVSLSEPSTGAEETPWSCAPQGDAEAEMDGSAPAAYLFTSGSTGTPKAVVLSRAALAAGAELTVRRFAWSARERLVNLPEPHTMSGLRNGLVTTWAGGLQWSVVGADRRADLFTLVEHLQRVGCERLVAGPTLVRHLAEFGDRMAPGALADLKAIYSTGAMLSSAAAARIHARVGVPVVNYYGLTETGGICIAQDVSDWNPRDTSLGTAAGAELRVLTDAGPAVTGEGELVVRSGQLMTGYLDDPEATAARLADGWLRTGDQARIDPDGRCWLIGRLGGFIKTASTDRVAPEEVEEALEAHPAVAEAAVVGVEAHEFERIAALVVLREAPPAGPAGLDREIAAFVRERLGAGRTPSLVRFVDRLPRTAAGKLSRSGLKELLG